MQYRLERRSLPNPKGLFVAPASSAIAPAPTAEELAAASDETAPEVAPEIRRPIEEDPRFREVEPPVSSAFRSS